jgi:hypothetical protein
MQHGKLTAAEAVKHFEANGYKDVSAALKASDLKEYNRVRKIVNDARLARVSDTRAGLLLEKYGGGRYVVSVHFEVAVIENE